MLDNHKANSSAGFDSYSDHDEILTLLPWYINGSLDSSEREKVEQHSRVCLICRSELDAQNIVASRVREVDVEALEVEKNFEVLRRRITTTGFTRDKLCADTKWSYSLVSRIRQLFDAAAFRPVAFASVTVLVIGLILQMQFDARQNNDPVGTADYVTLASPESVSNSAANEIIVVLSPQMSADELESLLASLNLRVHKGPDKDRVTRVRVEGPAGNRPRVEAVVAALKTNDKVLFAEPAIVGE